MANMVDTFVHLPRKLFVNLKVVLHSPRVGFHVELTFVELTVIFLTLGQHFYTNKEGQRIGS